MICGDRFRVNGVLVSCGDCIHLLAKSDSYPCKECRQARASANNLDNIAFEPVNKQYFLRLSILVRKHNDTLKGIKKDAAQQKVSFNELIRQCADDSDDTLRLVMDIK